MIVQETMSSLDFPVDIVARIEENKNLRNALDNNIRLISAELFIRRKAKLGDIIQIEDDKYEVVQVKDSLGINWLGINPFSQT